MAAAPASDNQAPNVSFDELFSILVEAYHADGSGMQFWETARSHRGSQVFEEVFVDFLTNKIKARSEDASMAEKIMARLSNPLLRQPAPFEF
jgi:hypothetical protein